MYSGQMFFYDYPQMQEHEFVLRKSQLGQIKIKLVNPMIVTFLLQVIFVKRRLLKMAVKVKRLYCLWRLVINADYNYHTHF